MSTTANGRPDSKVKTWRDDPQQSTRAHQWDFADMAPVEGLTDEEIDLVIAYVREHHQIHGLEPQPSRRGVPPAEDLPQRPGLGDRSRTRSLADLSGDHEPPIIGPSCIQLSQSPMCWFIQSVI